MASRLLFWLAILLVGILFVEVAAMVLLHFINKALGGPGAP